MTDLKPTESRIALAKGIAAGQVVDHGWIRGHVTWGNGYVSRIVTGRVAEFRVAGLLEGPGDKPEPPPRLVRLNAAGEAWLAEHGGGAG
jgi:hypothetical protein